MRAWILRTIAPYRTQLALLLGIQLLIAGLVAVQPIFFQRLVDSLMEGEAVSLPSFIALSAALGAVFLCVAAAQGAGGYVAALFSSDLLRRLQVSFFEKTAQLPLTYFRRHSAGEFFTRFNHDVGQAQSFVANVVPTFIREGVTATALIVVLAWFCPWQLVATAVLVSAISTALAVLCHRILGRYAESQRAGWGEINRQFDETVRGIDTIKTFGAEERRTQQFENETARFRSVSVDAGRTVALFSPTIDLVTRLGGLALVVIAYAMISGGTLRIETFVLFFFCSALLQGSVTEMIQLYTQMPPQLVGIGNLASFFLEEEEDAARSDVEEGSARIDRSLPIEFEGLEFSYPGGRELYGGATLSIPARSITIVQGPNGSGKSTLINLLLDFNRPTAGTITIGGQPLSKFSRKELRTQISVVTQYHHIFHDSLRENLRIAKPGASDEELLDALDQVGMTDFVANLPCGLDQLLDSSGKVISGGERQRICIARLLLRASPILVLDEPWSNLDEHAAQVLTQVLGRLRARCTVIVIAHHADRLGLRADRWMLLGSGGLERSGLPERRVRFPAA